MIIDTFANRLKQAMHLRNIKQVELSTKTNIDKSLISNYLSGNYSAKQENLYKIAKVLNVSESWLMGYDVSMERISTHNNTIKVDDNINYIGNISRTVQIPLLGKVPAGIPIEAIQDILGYEDIPYELIKNGERYFALKIDGNSMYPEYKTNDIIIVKQQADCISGQDCVVLVNGYDATFKRVIKEIDGIKLKPLNNDFETVKYTNDDILNKPVIIVGVATEVRRKLWTKKSI